MRTGTTPSSSSKAVGSQLYSLPRINEHFEKVSAIVGCSKRGEAQRRSEDSHVVDHKDSLFGWQHQLNA